MTKARILLFHDSLFPFVLYENQVLTQTLPIFFSSRSKEIVSDNIFTIKLLETLTEKSPFFADKSYFKCNSSDFFQPRYLSDCSTENIVLAVFNVCLQTSDECVFLLGRRQILFNAVCLVPSSRINLNQSVRKFENLGCFSKDQSGYAY